MVYKLIPKFLQFYQHSQVHNERSQVISALKGLLAYSQIANGVINRKKQLFFSMDGPQKDLGIDVLRRYRRASMLAKTNSIPMHEIAQEAIKRYDISSVELATSVSASNYRVTETFNHLIRDWCDLGDESRAELFKPILAELPRNGKRALLPGSGLGRLAAEVSNYMPVDALEIDPCLHIAAQYAISCKKAITVNPWILDFNYLRQAANQLESGTLFFGAEPKFELNLKYQNFLTLDPAQKYDCIVTLFFIDTAENVFEYLDKIEDLLAPGGVWINYGPLKWGTAAKIEFALDELKDVMRYKGWNLNKEWKGFNRYNGSPNSMCDAKYELSGWAATRVNSPANLDIK